MTFTTNEKIVAEYYIAAFGRTPDQDGLNYWVGQFESGAKTLGQIRDAFTMDQNIAEVAARFPADASTEEFVTSIYVNVLGRQPDQGGLDYWTARLDSTAEDAIPQNELLTYMLDAAKAATNDAATLSNKLAAAEYFISNTPSADPVSTDSVNSDVTTLALVKNTIDNITAQTQNVKAFFTLQESVVAGTEASYGDLMWDGISADAMINFLSSTTSIDLVQLGLIDDNGVSLVDSVNTVNSTNDGTISFTTKDGDTIETEAALGEDYIDFIENLLFVRPTTDVAENVDEANGYDGDNDVDLTSRFSQEVIAATEDSTQPIVLTTVVNNGGTFEAGVTGSEDTLIVAGRTELLHQAYIDAGEGMNTLEVDMKGVYAQPLAVLNVQTVMVQNLPNIYTTTQELAGYLRAEDCVDDCDVEIDDVTGVHYALGSNGLKIPLSTNTYPEISGTGEDSSTLDLSRAIDVTNVIITEGYNTGADLGILTVVGIRNNADLTFDGGFTKDVHVDYAYSMSDALNVTFNIGDVDAALDIAHNNATLNITSAGSYNTFHNDETDFGGSVQHMNISGDAEFNVMYDLDTTFNDGHPITIDASANTAGVDLNVTHDDEVNFTGTTADDHFTTVAGKSAVITTNSGNDEIVTDGSNMVTIDAGEGNNEISADSVTVSATITAGNGNNTISAESGTNNTITTGNGNNTITADAATLTVTTGTGSDTITVYGADVTVTTEGSDNTINVDAGTATDYTPNITLNVEAGTDSTVKLGSTGTTQAELDAAAANVTIVTAAVATLDADIAAMDATGKTDDEVEAELTALLDAAEAAGTISADDNAAILADFVAEDTDDNADNTADYVNDDMATAVAAAQDKLATDNNIDAATTTLTTAQAGITTNELTLNDGSTISGTNTTLVIDQDTDLSHATLTGVTSVIIDDETEANLADAEVVATMTVAQFTALTADAFSVQHQSFGATAKINIVISEDMNFNDLGDLSAFDCDNIDLTFTFACDATLTLTAEQLHNFVAPAGIDVEADFSGNVVVTNAGLGFVVEGDADGIDGTVLTNANNINVDVQRTEDGFERPTPNASTDVLTIDSTDAAVTVTAYDNDADGAADLGENDNTFTTLVIKGTNDVTFADGASVDMGENFTVDMSELTGTLTNFTIENFNEITYDSVEAGTDVNASNSANWGQVIGNGADDLRINITLDGNLGADYVANGGFKTEGVATYVVTDLSDANDDATIYLCDNSKDVEVIGLQGNTDGTLTVENAKWGVNFLLEGDGYSNWDQLPKALGNPDTSNIGNLTVDFFLAGAPVTIDINNQGVDTGLASDGTQRAINVDTITLTNTKDVTINVTDASAVLEGIVDDGSSTKEDANGAAEAQIDAAAIETLTITATEDVTLKMKDAAQVDGEVVLNTLDASGVAGTMTIEVTNANDDATLDLSSTDVSGVEAIVLDNSDDDDATITLNITQINDIGIENISASDVDTATEFAKVNVVGLDGSEFNLGTATENVTLGTVTIAQGDITLHENTDISGVAEIIIAEGSTLTMSADQYMMITANKINIAENSDDTTDTPTVLNITGVTQAHIDAGFSMAELNANKIGSDGAVDVNEEFAAFSGSVTLAEDVTLEVMDLNSDVAYGEDTVWNTDMKVILDSDQTITLANSTQADELVVERATAETTNTTITYKFNEILNTNTVTVVEDQEPIDGDEDITEVTIANVAAGDTVTVTVNGQEFSETMTTNGDNPDLDTHEEVLQSIGDAIELVFPTLVDTATAAGSVLTITGDVADFDLNISATVSDSLQIGASNYDVDTVKALNTFVDGTNIEYIIENLDSSVELDIYFDPEALGMVQNTDRVVNVLEGTTIADSIEFNDVQALQEVTTLTMNLMGDTTIDGDILIPSIDQTMNVTDEDLFQTLTINSIGSANTITGNITAVASDTSGTGYIAEDNNLLNVVINADTDLTLGLDDGLGSITGGNIVLSSKTDSAEANVTITGTANVTMHGIDATDANDDMNLDGDDDDTTANPSDIHTVNITNNSTGTLTMTGGTAAITSAGEAINFIGSGNIVLGNFDDVEGNDASEGLASTTVSTIDASALTGNLEMNEIGTLDKANFAFTAGTGVTTLTVTGATLEAFGTPTDANVDATATGWSFDMTNAAEGSQLTLDANTYSSGNEYTTYTATIDEDNLPVIAAADDELTITINGNAYSSDNTLGTIEGMMQELATNIEAGEDVTVTLDTDALTFTVTAPAGEAISVGTGLQFIDDVAADADAVSSDSEALNSALNITMGENAVLYVDADTNLTAIDLTFSGTKEIVLGENVVLTLTAEQASTLNIIADPAITEAHLMPTVDVANLGDTLVDLTNIDASIAGTVTLEDSDVTLFSDGTDETDLGAFSITLADSGDNTGLAGQTIRFSTEEQASGQEILVTSTDGTDDTNVVWLFDAVTATIDTDNYSEDLGRLWFNATLADGADVEDLFTTLPSSILRVDFATLTELDGALNGSTGVARTIELAHFTDLPNGLTFSDGDTAEHVTSLTVNMGGEVTVGDIVIDNFIDNTQTEDDTSFTTLTINSELADATGDLLATEGFDDTVHVAPDADVGNTIGNISVGAEGTNIDLTTVVVDANESDITIGKITFDSETLGTTATLTLEGTNDITIGAIDTSDTDISTLSIVNNSTGVVTIPGMSPAINASNTTTINIDVADNSTTIFGTEGDADKPGISGETVASINVANTTGGTGTALLDLGTIAIDSDNFTLVTALDAAAGASKTLQYSVTTDVDGNLATVDDGNTTVEEGDVVTVTIDGQSFSYTAENGDTIDDMMAALVNEVNENSTYTASITDDDDQDTDDNQFIVEAAAGESIDSISGSYVEAGQANGDGAQFLEDEAAATLAKGTLITIAGDTLNADGTWNFANANVTIAAGTVVNGTIQSTDGKITVDESVDLTSATLTLGGTSAFEVKDGQTLTLTLEQLDALTAAITGSGTVIVINGVDANGDTVLTSTTNVKGSMLKVANIDLSQLTIDTDTETEIALTVAVATDDNGQVAKTTITGSDVKLNVTATTATVGIIANAGLGNDVYTLTDNSEDDLINVTAISDLDTDDDGDVDGDDDLGYDVITGVVAEEVTNVMTAAEIDALEQDAFVVSADARANVTTNGDFYATAATSNDGTALITAVDTLVTGIVTVDMTLATGANGFTITGDATADSANTLIGSANDDIINGGNEDNAAAADVDTLTGNAGSDTFVFNIASSTPSSIITGDTADVDGEDEETITTAYVAGSDTGNETIDIAYKVDGTGSFITIDLTDVDVTDVDLVAAAIADEFVVAGITVSASTDGSGVATFAADAGISFDIVSSTVADGNGLATTADADGGTDVEQDTYFKFDAATVVIGEVYTMAVTLAEGTNISTEFTATTTDSADVLEGLTANFNTLADAATVVVTEDGTEIRLLDEEANDGGFTVAFSSSAAITSNGASDDGATDIATLDVITDFTTADDSIDLGIVAGSATNYAEEATEVVWNTNLDTTYGDALTAAGTAMDGTVQFYLTSIATDDAGASTGILFFDANGDGDVNGAINLTGIDSTTFDFTDIIA